MKLPFLSTRIALGLTLGLGLLPLSAQPCAKPHAGAGPKHCPIAKGGDPIEAMAKRLKLTDDQKKAIQDIHAKHADALKAKGEACETAHKALREALHEAADKAETPADQLRPLHKAAADARFEMMLEHRALRQEIRAQLTPEQREKCARMEGFHKGRHGGMKGHGCPGDEGGFGPKPCCEGAPDKPAECPMKAPAKQ